MRRNLHACVLGGYILLKQFLAGFMQKRRRRRRRKEAPDRGGSCGYVVYYYIYICYSIYTYNKYLQIFFALAVADSPRVSSVLAGRPCVGFVLFNILLAMRWLLPKTGKRKTFTSTKRTSTQR